jgi:tetratricopeptide (TPR) repeat protein
LRASVTVTAALIVKDEERFLPGCLASIKGCVEEIVIVDTGSTDATVTIAAAAGARVLHRAWAGDFAAARNHGLEAATGEWILYIDADERMRLPRGGMVGDYILPDAIAAYVQFCPKSGYTRYREPRLFRRDPRIRFAGAIHETMLPAVREISAKEGLAVVSSTVEIDHLGYDGDQSHKYLRNLPLLKRAVRTDPDRVYYWYHLAETLLAIGLSDKAREAASNGLAAAARKPDEKQIADASMITQTMTRLMLDRGEDPLQLIDEGLERMSSDYGLLFLRGRALLYAGRAEEALEVAVRLRRTNVSAVDGGLLAFDRGIFADKACELAALACLRLGHRSDAGAWFEEASRLAPENSTYRLKAAAFLNSPAAREHPASRRV